MSAEQSIPSVQGWPLSFTQKAVFASISQVYYVCLTALYGAWKFKLDWRIKVPIPDAQTPAPQRPFAVSDSEGFEILLTPGGLQELHSDFFFNMVHKTKCQTFFFHSSRSPLRKTGGRLRKNCFQNVCLTVTTSGTISSNGCKWQTGGREENSSHAASIPALQRNSLWASVRCIHSHSPTFFFNPMQWGWIGKTPQTLLVKSLSNAALNRCNIKSQSLMCSPSLLSSQQLSTCYYMTASIKSRVVQMLVKTKFLLVNTEKLHRSE